jgi:hypothetical protein
MWESETVFIFSLFDERFLRLFFRGPAVLFGSKKQIKQGYD